MKLICFGDSLTFGSIGHSYVKYLKETTSYTVKNKGVNGDTTMHMLSRLNLFLDRSNPKISDTYIICIGTNDLLLPYLASVSPLWNIQMKPRIAMMQCLSDDNLFRNKYREIIECILSKQQDLIIVGLPYLELKDFPNDKIDQRNKIIKDLALEYQITYIDTKAIQKEISSTVTVQYSWKYKNFLRLIEGVIFPVMPGLKDYFSNARHLCFTNDGVHWNSVLAKRLSAQIANVLILQNEQMKRDKKEEYIICPRCKQEVFKEAVTCPFCDFGIMAWIDGKIDENGDKIKETEK